MLELILPVTLNSDLRMEMIREYLIKKDMKEFFFFVVDMNKSCKSQSLFNSKRLQASEHKKTTIKTKKT